MTLVKADFPPDETHASLLMGLLFRQIRAVFAEEDWAGLRQSHFRVMASVPEGGVSITELAARVDMTKQGCGQFVAQLAQSGHLAVGPDPGDRRIRVVRRTPRGQATLDAVRDRNLRIEADWASRVGEQRYHAFREVLEELAIGSLPA